jgi:glycosyltransferase involved in cell wall biosynthesis
MVSPKVEMRSGYSSLKVYECLACGRPLIAPDTPGLSFISSKELGFTYKSNDIQELSECILKMQNLTEDKWVKMCTSARKIAVSEYSWDIAAEQIRNIAFAQSQS